MPSAGLEERFKGANVALTKLPFDRGTTNFTGVVAQAKAAGVEHVVFLGIPKDAALVMREANNLGWKPQFSGHNALGDPQTFQLAGPLRRRRHRHRRDGAARFRQARGQGVPRRAAEVQAQHQADHLQHARLSIRQAVRRNPQAHGRQDRRGLDRGRAGRHEGLRHRPDGAALRSLPTGMPAPCRARS